MGLMMRLLDDIERNEQTADNAALGTYRGLMTHPGEPKAGDVDRLRDAMRRLDLTADDVRRDESDLKRCETLRRLLSEAPARQRSLDAAYQAAAEGLANAATSRCLDLLKTMGKVSPGGCVDALRAVFKVVGVVNILNERPMGSDVGTDAHWAKLESEIKSAAAPLGAALDARRDHDRSTSRARDELQRLTEANPRVLSHA